MEQEKQYIPSQEELEQLKRDAEQGDAEAQYELAICYRNGSGVEEDLEKHIYWLRLSAEQENVDAMWRMFLSYARGIGVEKDVEKAKYWYFKGEKCTEEVLREKAENGDIKSQGIMARLCGILQDDEGELYWIKRTADQGHFYAIYLLSDKYFHRGDFEESKRLMLILAKQSKSSNVFYDCGRAHERTGDIKGAIYWYKRVVRKGDSNVEVAKIALKRMEERLKTNDLRIDTMEENKTISQEELEQLMRDAEQGDAEAQCSLGQCYARGWGVETDLDVAFYWYAKAAEQGKATAQFNLGQYYYMYMQDYKQAAKWFTLAAEQGHMYARHNLATLYYHGQGVRRNYKKAAGLFEKAAEQGVVPAMSFIGQCYDFGKGVPCDMEKAVYWFSKAAEKGDAVAQYNLASCYENGNCVVLDVDKAVYWYTKAAEQGIDVEEELERLKNND